jgi:glyoxylase-like metal-dependent hydrolase (beta-lactamase superfamily II)
MEQWTTSSGYHVYQVLKGRGNAYLVSAGDHHLLVDTGMKSSFRRLGQTINGLLPKGKTLDFLVLTHTHYDHCQSARRIRDKENCRVVLGQPESSYAQKGFAPLPRGTSLMPRLLTGIGNLMGKKAFGYLPFEADIEIDDDYDLMGGLANVRLITTPGHSPGSVSLLVDDEVAVVGDAAFGIFRNTIFPPFADDTRRLIQSWKKLLDTPCHIFLPGHGGPISRKMLEKEYRRHSKR